MSDRAPPRNYGDDARERANRRKKGRPDPAPGPKGKEKRPAAKRPPEAPAAEAADPKRPSSKRSASPAAREKSAASSPTQARRPDRKKDPRAKPRAAARDDDDRRRDDIELAGGHSDQQAGRQAQPVDDEKPPRLPFPVVGIGTSAGGIEAFTEFLHAMPPESGLAFVLIQHLPPDRESMMPAILARETKMPVKEVEDGEEVLPDHVYTIRPRHTLTLRNGRLHLLETPTIGRPARPIDDFFRSLAEEQRERAICIIMAGMGSNGTSGAQAVKAVGGLCIAQDPETTGFGSMPRHLIAAGYADYVLRPADIPDVLLGYASHPYARGAREADSQTLIQKDQQHLREILAILRTRTRHDFSGYKKATLLRRVQRRMGLHRVTKVRDYARTLRQSPSEVVALADDLLIHVTGFFRDPEAWEILRREVVGPLVAGREDGGSIRCWVAACSSGEEAYSLAILLVEEATRLEKHLDIKVFATDMAERTLQNARHGVYPGGIEVEIEPGRLHRFFEQDDALYRVRPELREAVVFAPQDILRDPPFSRLDIVTCRNLLIYLEPTVQQRVLELLHFGLRDGGALFLGTSETVGAAEYLFAPIDKKARIFRRIGPTRHGTVQFPIPHALLAAVERAPEDSGRSVPKPTLQQLLHRALLEQHVPGAVLVDRDFRILYFHGDTDLFFSQPRAEPTRDLFSIAREPIRGAIRTVLMRSQGSGGPESVDDGLVETPGGVSRVVVTASPLASKPMGSLFVLSFGLRAEPSGAEEVDESEKGPESETELRRMREELQSTIEELQTTNEELKASNEEVMSINEELQSTNEELETSREEMQSLNEELTTVNAQLQSKIEEHQHTSSDLNSLLTSTDIGVVFLDSAFRIRRFTPAVRNLFDLIAGDIGRPIWNLARKFEDADLDADVKAVLERLIPIEREVPSTDGRWYLRRITPYRTDDNKIDGVVLSFIDVTARRHAEDSLRAAELRLQREVALMQSLHRLATGWHAPEQVHEHLAEALGTALRVVGADLGAVRLMQPELHLATSRDTDAGLASAIGALEQHDAAGEHAVRSGQRVILEDLEGEAGPAYEVLLGLGIRAAHSVPVRMIGGGTLGSLSFYYFDPRPIADDDLELMESCARRLADIVTGWQRYGETRQRSALLEALPNPAWTLDAAGRCTWCNERWLEVSAQSRDGCREFGWLEAIHPDDRDSVLNEVQSGIGNRRGFEFCCRIGPRRGEGGHQYLVQLRRASDPLAPAREWIATATSVKSLREVEDIRSEIDEIVRSLFGNVRDVAIVMADPEGRVTQWNSGAELAVGTSEAEALGSHLALLFTPEDRENEIPASEMARAVRDGAARDERWHLRRDGSRFWAAGVLTALKSSTGRLRGYLKIFRDETESKQIEWSLKAAKESAELANHAKDEFLATLGHELRTPVSAILIWAKLLRNRSLAPDQLHEGVDAIERTAKAQKQLIDDLLDTARIASGKLRLELRPTNFATLVRDAIDAIRPTAEAKAIELVESVGEVGVVLADPDRLQQVLWNILSNAVKFTPERGRIGVVLRLAGHRVELAVADSGVGIEPDLLPHVFEAFRQGESSSIRGFGGLGLGLGLAISKKLVEQHGGGIDAQSPGRDQGTTITVRLPVRVAPPGGVAAEASRRSEEEFEPPPLRPGLRVLVVEDDLETRKALEAFLASAGAAASVADSADAAIRRIEADPPDILVSDVAMNREDGYSLMRRVRESESKDRRRRLPAIALTAFVRDTDRSKAIEAGFDRHLGKPVDPLQLLAAIHELTSGSD